MTNVNKICNTHGELDHKDIKQHVSGYPVCRICHRAQANKKRNENRDWFNAKQAQHKVDNPEKWEQEYKRQYRKQRENHGELLSLKKVCNARGITLDNYFEMLEDQDFRCAICRQEETCKDSKHDRARRLSIDHCHESGEVRGLLCHSCNTALGKFKDDVNMMQKAIEYILNDGWVT